MIEGKIVITATRQPKRELTRHERVYNIGMLILAVLAWSSVVLMYVLGSVDKWSYFWLALLVAVAYYSCKKPL